MDQTLVRAYKDQERIRLAFEIVESLESLTFFRRGKNSPRTIILKLLQNMSTQIKRELEDIE